MKTGLTAIKFYFVVVSLVGIIGLTVAYAGAIYTYLLSHVITDEEYVAGVYPPGVYLGDQCNSYNQKGEKNILSQEQIEQCKQDTLTNAIHTRSKENKQSILSGLVRGTMFLILFLIHFPLMIKYNKQDSCGSPQDN